MDILNTASKSSKRNRAKEKNARWGEVSSLRLCAVRFCTPPGMATDLSLSTPAANATREGGS